MTNGDETNRPVGNGPSRRGHDYRVGVFSAAAVMVAATVGTLASAPEPTGSEGPAPVQVSSIEPEWSDGLDHVVVMTERVVDDVVESPATPEPVTVDPSLLPDTDGGAPLPPDDVVRTALEAVPGVVSVAVVAPGTFAVATSGSRDALLAVPGVAELHEDVLFAPTTDPDEGRQWALRNTGSPTQANGWPGVPGADADVVPVWEVSEGAGVVVAVVDTGVDLTHPDLTGRLWANTDEVCANGVDDDANGFVDDCRGWDFGTGDNDPADDRGRPSSDHGTHVAGIIAAGRNGVGVVGVAPQATIMPVKVSRSSDGLFPGSAIYSGIIYAVDNGAQVINMSFGTGPGVSRSSVSLQERAVQYALERGVTLVAAAGNSAVDIGSTPAWPAAFSQYYPGVVTVGATTNSDAKASFSNYGSPVSIWAPGQMLLSTLPGGLLGFKSGTSMAAPVVAGAAAHLLATGVATAPAEVRAQLVSTARSGPAGPYLDVAEAVGAVAPPSANVVYEGAQSLAADTAGSIGVRISAPTLAPGVTAARVSLATAEAGVVYAVEGLPVRVTTADQGQVQTVSGIDGALAAIPLGPTTQIGPGDWRFELSTTLPAGMYAVVTELVDLTGTARGGAFVGFVQVGAAPGPGIPPGPIVTSPVTTSPVTTMPVPVTTSPVTTMPVPGTTVPQPAPAPPPPTAPVTSTPTVTSTVPAPPTTLPAPAPAPVPSWPAPSTTMPVMAPTIPPPVTQPSPPPPTTTAPTPTTAPQPPTITSPPTFPPGTLPPATPPPVTLPPTTTPAPDPDTSGDWRLDAMTPRLASTAGGAPLELLGRFPTNVPVYVWFGDLAVVEAENTGTRLKVTSPAVARVGVVDVVVRFTTAQSHALVLSEAFTFVAPSTAPPNPVSPSPETPGTTVPTQPAPTTTIGAPAPTPAPTPTTQPVPVTPPTTAPTPPTTMPAPAPSSTVAQPAPTTTEVVVTRGQLRLRALPANSALGRLAAVPWPGAGCTSTTCPTTSI